MRPDDELRAAAAALDAAAARELAWLDTSAGPIARLWITHYEAAAVLLRAHSTHVPDRSCDEAEHLAFDAAVAFARTIPAASPVTAEANNEETK